MHACRIVGVPLYDAARRPVNADAGLQIREVLDNLPWRWAVERDSRKVLPKPRLHERGQSLLQLRIACFPLHFSTLIQIGLT